MINIYVICEGASEKAYLQKMNQYLRDYEFPHQFIIKNAGGGTVRHMRECLRAFFKENRHVRGEVWLWLDNDLYARKDEDREQIKKIIDQYKQISPQLVWNTHNYEDYLSLHLPPELAKKWCSIMREKNHFSTPLYAAQYEKLFTEFVKENTDLPPYKKGKNETLNAMNWDDALQHLRNASETQDLDQCSDMRTKILAILDLSA